MRSKLKAHEDDRRRFSAVFERFGKKTNYHGFSEETVLLKNVTDIITKAVVADHLWFNYSKTFQQSGLSPGDLVEFDARVKQYKKGYVNKPLGVNNQKIDYKLSHPTRIIVMRK